MMQRTAMKCVLSYTMLASALLGLLACATSTAQKSTPAATASPTETATPTASPIASVNAYLGVGDAVYALDGRTGAKRWTYDTGQHTNSGSVDGVLSGGGRVFFENNHDNSVYALDAAHGRLLWKLSGLIVGQGQLFLDGSTLFVDATSVQAPNALFVVDVTSGKMLWEQKDMGGSLAIGSDAVYVARTLPGSDAEPVTNGLVAAFSRTDGRQLWQVQGHPFSGVLLGSAGIYAAADDTVYALDARTGSTLWTKQFGQFVALNTLLGSTLYVLDNSSAYALDIGSQAVRWRFPVALGYMVYASGLFCVGSHDHLYGVDATTGAQLWAQQSADGYSDLAADAGSCYSITFATNRAPLDAFDLRTGVQRWRHNALGIYGPMFPTAGMLFALSDPSAPGCCTPTLVALSVLDGLQVWQFAPGVAFPGAIAIG